MCTRLDTFVCTPTVVTAVIGGLTVFVVVGFVRKKLAKYCEDESYKKENRPQDLKEVRDVATFIFQNHNYYMKFVIGFVTTLALLVLFQCTIVWGGASWTMTVGVDVCCSIALVATASSDANVLFVSCTRVRPVL